MESINFDDIDDENEETFENSDVEQGSDRQQLDEIYEKMEEYKNNIQLQAASLQPVVDPKDFIEDFVFNELGLNSMGGIEDLSIMVDPDLGELDRMKLDKLVEDMNEVFDSTFGISFEEPDMQLCYYLYQVLVTHFNEYFMNYIVGLQNLTPDYESDIPNYNELSLKYFMKKINEPKLNIKVATDYINYIADQGVEPNFYFDISLLGSPGNETLSKLYIEHTNDRMSIDSEFFTTKFRKLISSSDVIELFTVNKLVDIFSELC